MGALGQPDLLPHDPSQCTTSGKCQDLDLECQGVIQMKNGAMLHLGKTTDDSGRYKIVEKENLINLRTDVRGAPAPDTENRRIRVDNAERFTRKVLKVLLSSADP